MTVKEFDQITTSPVWYDVFDEENHLVQWFSRDVSQSPDLYRLHMIRLDKYANAKIVHVYSLNDVIHASAVIYPKDHL